MDNKQKNEPMRVSQLQHQHDLRKHQQMHQVPEMCQQLLPKQMHHQLEDLQHSPKSEREHQMESEHGTSQQSAQQQTQKATTKQLTQVETQSAQQQTQKATTKRLTQVEREYWQQRLPRGFQFYLERLARGVIRNQPVNILEFSAVYLEELLVSRNELWNLPVEPYFTKLYRRKIGHAPWQPRRRHLSVERDELCPCFTPTLPDIVATELLPMSSLLSDERFFDLSSSEEDKDWELFRDQEDAFDSPEMLTASDCLCNLRDVLDNLSSQEAAHNTTAASATFDISSSDGSSTSFNEAEDVQTSASFTVNKGRDVPALLCRAQFILAENMMLSPSSSQILKDLTDEQVNVRERWIENERTVMEMRHEGEQETLQPFEENIAKWGKKCQPTDEKLASNSENLQPMEEKSSLKREKLQPIEEKLTSNSEKFQPIEKLASNSEKFQPIEEKLTSNSEKSQPIEEKLASNRETLQSMEEKFTFGREEVGYTNNKLSDNINIVQVLVMEHGEKVMVLGEKVMELGEKVVEHGEKELHEMKLMRSEFIIADRDEEKQDTVLVKNKIDDRHLSLIEHWENAARLSTGTHKEIVSIDESDKRVHVGKSEAIREQTKDSMADECFDQSMTTSGFSLERGQVAAGTFSAYSLGSFSLPNEVGPGIEVLEEMRPEIEVLCEEIRPEIEVLCEEIRPEIEVLCEEMRPEIEVLCEEMRPEIEVPEEMRPEIEIPEEMRPEIETYHANVCISRRLDSLHSSAPIGTKLKQAREINPQPLSDNREVATKNDQDCSARATEFCEERFGSENCTEAENIADKAPASGMADHICCANSCLDGTVLTSGWQITKSATLNIGHSVRLVESDMASSENGFLTSPERRNPNTEDSVTAFVLEDVLIGQTGVLSSNARTLASLTSVVSDNSVLSEASKEEYDSDTCGPISEIQTEERSQKTDRSWRKHNRGESHTGSRKPHAEGSNNRQDSQDLAENSKAQDSLVNLGDETMVEATSEVKSYIHGLWQEQQTEVSGREVCPVSVKDGCSQDVSEYDYNLFPVTVGEMCGSTRWKMDLVAKEKEFCLDVTVDGNGGKIPDRAAKCTKYRYHEHLLAEGTGYVAGCADDLEGTGYFAGCADDLEGTGYVAGCADDLEGTGYVAGCADDLEGTGYVAGCEDDLEGTGYVAGCADDLEGTGYVAGCADDLEGTGYVAGCEDDLEGTGYVAGCADDLEGTGYVAGCADDLEGTGYVAGCADDPEGKGNDNLTIKYNKDALQLNMNHDLSEMSDESCDSDNHAKIRIHISPNKSELQHLEQILPPESVQKTQPGDTLICHGNAEPDAESKQPCRHVAGISKLKMERALSLVKSYIFELERVSSGIEMMRETHPMKSVTEAQIVADMENSVEYFNASTTGIPEDSKADTDAQINCVSDILEPQAESLNREHSLDVSPSFLDQVSHKVVDICEGRDCVRSFEEDAQAGNFEYRTGNVVFKIKRIQHARTDSDLPSVVDDYEDVTSFCESGTTNMLLVHSSGSKLSNSRGQMGEVGSVEDVLLAVNAHSVNNYTRIHYSSGSNDSLASLSTLFTTENNHNLNCNNHNFSCNNHNFSCNNHNFSCNNHNLSCNNHNLNCNNHNFSNNNIEYSYNYYHTASNTSIKYFYDLFKTTSDMNVCWPERLRQHNRGVCSHEIADTAHATAATQSVVSPLSVVMSRHGNTNNNGNVSPQSRQFVMSALPSDDTPEKNTSVDACTSKQEATPPNCGPTAKRNRFIIEGNRVYSVPTKNLSPDRKDNKIVGNMGGTKQGVHDTPPSDERSQRDVDCKVNGFNTETSCNRSTGNREESSTKLKKAQRLNSMKSKQRCRTKAGPCVVKASGMEQPAKEEERKENSDISKLCPLEPKCRSSQDEKLGESGQLDIQTSDSSKDISCKDSSKDSSKDISCKDIGFKDSSSKPGAFSSYHTRRRKRAELEGRKKGGKSKRAISKPICLKRKNDDSKPVEKTNESVTSGGRSDVTAEKCFTDELMHHPARIRLNRLSDQRISARNSQISGKLASEVDELSLLSTVELPCKRDFPLRIRDIGSHSGVNSEYVPNLTRQLTVESPTKNLLVHSSFLRPNPRMPGTSPHFELTSQKKRLYLGDDHEFVHADEGRRLICETECFASKDPTTKHLVIENGTSDTIHATVKVVTGNIHKRKRKVSPEARHRDGNMNDPAEAESDLGSDESILYHKYFQKIGNYIVFGVPEPVGSLQKLIQQQELRSFAVDNTTNRSSNALLVTDVVTASVPSIVQHQSLDMFKGVRRAVAWHACRSVTGQTAYNYRDVLFTHSAHKYKVTRS